MKQYHGIVCGIALAVVAATAEPIHVSVSKDNTINVEGKKVLPIGVWLQPEETFAMWKELGVNWFLASSHPSRGGTLENYLKAADDHDVWVSIGYQWAQREGKLDEVLNHPRVLTLHHNDEPDKPKTYSDATIEKGAGLRENGSRPLFSVLDGNLRSSAVLDPVPGGSFTIKLQNAVTARKLAMAVEAGNYQGVKDVEFLGDGQLLTKVELAFKTGLQEFPLAAPATFSALTVNVLSAHEGKGTFGAIAEVQALDAEGRNLLLSPPRDSATETPEEIMADYKAIKALDKDRLVSLCLMSRFMPEVAFNKIPMEMYRQYPPATDLLMFDLYPVSVYNGRNLHWNALGLDQLREMAGPDKALGIWLQASDAMNKNDPGMTPEQIRANVWLSLIHGATFIGWFPQTFNPKFKFHEINAERRAAVKAVNQEITALASLILAPYGEDVFAVQADGGRVDAMQRSDGNQALLVLVNVDESGAGQPVSIKLAPKAPKPDFVPAFYETGKPLTASAGGWTVKLKPWETAVILAAPEK